MSVNIITDSGCDIYPYEAEALGIRVIPLRVFIGDKEYLDGIDFTHEEFYDKMKEMDTLPTSSQVSPAEYEEIFAEETKDGNEAIYIPISSKLSGSIQSAMIGADDNENISIVDSMNVCIGQRILVEYANNLAKQGMSRNEIVEKLEYMKKRIKIFALMDTLENLKRGGRISPLAAAAGEILSIKPVIAFNEEGYIGVVGKARGSKNGYALLNKFIEEAGGINYDLPYAVSYSGSSDVTVNKYLEGSTDIFVKGIEEIPLYTIGSAVGTHAGIGAIAVAFFMK